MSPRSGSCSTAGSEKQPSHYRVTLMRHLLAIEFTWGPAIPQPMTEREAIEEDAGSGFIVSFAAEQPC